LASSHRCRAGERQDRRGGCGASGDSHPAHSRAPRLGDAPLQALIIDSWFDNYVGVVSLVRVMNGRLKRGDKMRVVSTGRSHLVDRLGRFTPKSVVQLELPPATWASWSRHREIDGAPVGDTITLENRPAAHRSRIQADQAGCSPGCFRSTRGYEKFRDALAKLRLNDSALHYEPEVSGPSASAFAAGFSDCCTWTSCRSVSSANTSLRS